MSDSLWYAKLACAEYPEIYANNKASFGKDGPQISAEEMYIVMHGEVPEWAVFIERFEIAQNGDYIFVHRKIFQ